MVVGPEFLVQFAAGNLPNPTLVSMILGMLTRSAQLIKCARGTALLPRLFAHSIYEIDPKLAACLEIVDWPGGSEALEAYSTRKGIELPRSEERLTSSDWRQWQRANKDAIPERIPAR